MQKLIACNAVSAEAVTNKHLESGWVLAPETIRIVPGVQVPVPEKDRKHDGPTHRSIAMFFAVVEDDSEYAKP